MFFLLSSLFIASCEDDDCIPDDDQLIGNWLYVKSVSTDHLGVTNMSILDTSISKNVQSYTCEGEVIDFNFWFDDHPSDSTIGSYWIDGDTLIIRIYMQSPIDAVKEIKYLYSFNLDTLINRSLLTETGITMSSYLVRRSDTYLNNLLEMLNE